MASSLLGGTPVVGMMGLRIGKCLQTRARLQLLLARTLCPPSDLYSSNSKCYQLKPPGETAVGQGCHCGFHKREGNPSSERLSDSSKVTSKSVGRLGALPAGNCARACCRFLKAQKFLPPEARFPSPQVWAQH